MFFLWLWQRDGFELQQAGGDCIVTLKGRYDGFAGSYRYVIHVDGHLEATATFVRTGFDVRVREIGLSFAVPRECDLLQWQRRAEWSLYPDDHVGRPVGETRALDVHQRRLPPDWPWSKDDTPLGCNDFRSTKRSIEWGWIGLADGPGIAIRSDGSQNLHASIDGDRIAVVVTDFLSGVNGRGEWTENYGTGRVLKKGETLTATVKLELREGRLLPPR